MITISELDLLILDEPTNNLDIATVDQEVIDENWLIDVRSPNVIEIAGI